MVEKIYVEVDENSVVICNPKPGKGDKSIEVTGLVGLDLPMLGWVYNSESGTFEGTPSLVAVRAQRDKDLKACDWRVLPDYQGTDGAAWEAYRQSLRDLPAEYSEGVETVFPTPPVVLAEDPVEPLDPTSPDYTGEV